MVDGAQTVVVDLDGCGHVRMPIVAKERRHCMKETRRRRGGGEGYVILGYHSPLAFAAPHLSQKLSSPHAICVSDKGFTVQNIYQYRTYLDVASHMSDEVESAGENSEEGGGGGMKNAEVAQRRSQNRIVRKAEYDRQGAPRLVLERTSSSGVWTGAGHWVLDGE